MAEDNIEYAVDEMIPAEEVPADEETLSPAAEEMEVPSVDELASELSAAFDKLEEINDQLVNERVLLTCATSTKDTLTALSQMVKGLESVAQQQYAVMIAMSNYFSNK